MSWPELLEKNRVVILAEAGAGKTSELREQALALSKAGQTAFYATVQDVARDGLPGALIREVPRAAFRDWKNSTDDAWFFIDSVDEAKLDGVSLEKCLQRLADAIEGANRRAHILLSGRYSDWEFRGDLQSFSTILPVPQNKPAPEPPSTEQLLRATLRRERQAKEPEEILAPAVVVMASLDESRVRLFATAAGISGVDEFIRAIDAGNLWQFARRPLDLQWLVTYWKAKGHFGNLAEMLELSLRERLREPNPNYARKDSLQIDHSLAALERIGAALVFGMQDKILIPDSSLWLEGSSGLDLAVILPDWSSEGRQRLLTRAVFDPGTYGHVRLHNDNEGTVRSYLAARWLYRRKASARSRAIGDLLFSDIYGVPLVRPSLRQTAAWLSIWDTDVAREVVAREPALLMNYGDPGSLPLSVRESVLESFVRQIVTHEAAATGFEEDRLRRFSAPDLAPKIHALWSQHKNDVRVRVPLLKMIDSGAIAECEDTAEEAVFAEFDDDRTIYLGGRALLAAASNETKQKYARHILAHAATLPSVAIWEGLEKLFPDYIGVSDLLSLLADMDAGDRSDSLGFAYRGPRLIGRIAALGDLGPLLAGLLSQLGPGRQEYGTMETPEEKAYLPSITATAQRILELTPPAEAPLAAMDAVMRLKQAEHFRSVRTESDAVMEQVQLSPERRRAAFWRAAQMLTAAPFLNGKPLEQLWQINILGWPMQLSTQDFDWLAVDATCRADEAERFLAFGTLLEVWRAAGNPDDLLARIREIAHRSSTKFEQKLSAWLAPRETTAQEKALKAEAQAHRRKHDEVQAERDKSWKTFIDDVKANPDRLRNPLEPTADTVDAWLYYLWQLFEGMHEGANRYSFADTTLLEPLVGKEATAAFREGLRIQWRRHAPILKSDRPADKRNTIKLVDCMGITAISIEAKDTANWASRLLAGEAERATAYATLEINGLPSWMSALAEQWPDPVGTILLKEIEFELDNPTSGPRVGVLEDVARATPAVNRTVALPLFARLKSDFEIPLSALSSVLTIILKGIDREMDELRSLCLRRFSEAASEEAAGKYLTTAFAIDPSAAVEALSKRLDALERAGQTRLAQRVLPQLVGDRVFNRGIDLALIPVPLMHRLLLIAFQTIRYEEDNRRPDGEVYSPDERDHAQHARDALFTQFIQTPGRPVYESLRTMADMKGFPLPPERMLEIARERAQFDSNLQPWPAMEVFELEQKFDAIPQTPAELQEVALHRIADIQHDLINADFAQGATLKLLPDEKSVQIWVANELSNRKERAYSVERESHVVEEKEPDLRLRAKAADASLPIEVKVAESWSLTNLEEALEDQLANRYLRAKDARHGVLLLVHKRRRARGWIRASDGIVLSFAEVVRHLQTRADILAAQFGGPQIQVAILNVSELPENHNSTL